MTSEPTAQRDPAGRFRNAPGPGRPPRTNGQDVRNGPTAEALTAELLEAPLPHHVSLAQADAGGLAGLTLDGVTWRRLLFTAYRHGWRPGGARRLELPAPQLVNGVLTAARATTRHGLLPGAAIETVPGYLLPPFTLPVEETAALADALAQASDDGDARALAATLRSGPVDVLL